MLYNRLNLILEYLKSIESGQIEKNDQVLRDVASLCYRLPVVDSDSFTKEFRNVSSLLLIQVMDTVVDQDFSRDMVTVNIIYSQSGTLSHMYGNVSI